MKIMPPVPLLALSATVTGRGRIRRKEEPAVARKCPECIVDVMDAQVSLHFRAVGTGSNDWLEAPVIAGICPKCGRMELYMATPGQFKIWLDSQKAKARAGGAGRS